MRGKLREIGEAESRRTRRKLANLRPVQPDGSAPAGEAGGEDEAAAIERVLDEHTHRLINKVLHLPLSRLDPAAIGEDAGAQLDAAALRRLFDLDGDEADGERGDG